MKTYVISVDEIWHNHEHRNNVYVCTEDDMDVMGWTDFDLQNFSFPSREEAEARMQELKAYADENDFACQGWHIEEFDEI